MPRRFRFQWDDEVVINATEDDIGTVYVDDANLLEMLRTVIWRSQVGNADLHLNPTEAVEQIADLVRVRGDGITDVSPWVADDMAIHVEPFCTCGHPLDEHQTGEGPWSGFCYDHDCKCERPTPDQEEPS